MKLSFIAEDPYIVSHIVKPTESVARNHEFVQWGEHNDYPKYLDYLYDNSVTLHTIINAMVDYICGSEIKTTVKILEKQVNTSGYSLKELINDIALDYVRYGGFAFQVIRNKAHDICSLYYVDFSKCRTNKDHTLIWYSDWSGNVTKNNTITYPNFCSDAGQEATSSIYWYASCSKKTYPSPQYSAAVLACEMENKIAEYSLNLMTNSLQSNYMINFNNGVPTDDQQEEIEMLVYNKFCSEENAGRPLITYNNDKEHAAEVVPIPADNWAEKYEKIKETCKEQIFASFRANPALIGINQTNIGFSQQEFSEAFKIFNKTVIEPYQQKIKLAFDKIFGPGSLYIAEFKINFDPELKNIEDTQNDE